MCFRGQRNPDIPFQGCDVRVDFRAFTVASTNGFLRVLKTNVTVKISPILVQRFNLEPKEVEVSAVWDTGAMATVICQRIANELGLIPITKRKVCTANSTRIANVYMVDILLPNRVYISSVEVTDMPDTLDCDMLIGMDIFRFGDASITNANKKTVFSFRVPPNYKHIDYTAEAARIREKRVRRRKHKAKKR